MLWRIVFAGVFASEVLFGTILHSAFAADLLLDAQQTIGPSTRIPIVQPKNQTSAELRDNSIFLFAGMLSTSNMGSAAVFNAFPVATRALNSPNYDNYIFGAAYQRRLYELGYRFVLNAEVGIADRFGRYAACCDDYTIKSSTIRHSGEIWFGPVFRYESIVLFNKVRMTPSLSVGLSLTSNSIGVERARELSYDGNGRILFYLGPEISFSSLSMPNFEVVLRLHHRSGAGGKFGGLREGYNANVIGLRYWY